eukprot:g21108.t1
MEARAAPARCEKLEAEAQAAHEGGEKRKGSLVSRTSSDPDRIDETTLNAALFFTVKPSELRILSVLGSGAHANVYQAEWTRTFAAGTSSIIVAVKQLHTDLGEVYRNRERLTMLTDPNTARPFADHPNLVKCVDSTLEPPYLIITEFLAGGSLFDLLYNSSQQLSIWQQVKILLDIASGMRYLHEQKPCILHRDLKSSNVLLAKPLRSATQEPFAKVADFGLARASDDVQQAMTAGVGTWRWMAPEVFASDPDSDDAAYNLKADVYSFGILMYEVLERQLPYSEKFGTGLRAGGGMDRQTDVSDPRIGLHVCRGLRPAMKPISTDDGTHEVREELKLLMQRAWSNEPEDLPMSAMASVATVPVSFGTQQPDGSTFYGSFEAQTTYPSRGSFMPPSPPPPAPRALSRPRVSGVQSPLPPLVQPKGDVAPMLPERSPCGPMKSLDPPGLIAAGIPWLDSLSPWQPTRPPSPMPVARARSVSPCPSPIHRVVRTTRHAAPCASCCRAPVPILPSTARRKRGEQWL